VPLDDSSNALKPCGQPGVDGSLWDLGDICARSKVSVEDLLELSSALEEEPDLRSPMVMEESLAIRVMKFKELDDGVDGASTSGGSSQKSVQ